MIRLNIHDPLKRRLNGALPVLNGQAQQALCRLFCRHYRASSGRWPTKDNL